MTSRDDTLRGRRRLCREIDIRHTPHFGRLDFQEAGSLEIEHAGDDVVREVLDLVVVVENGVIKCLPGERHLVFGRGELFLELHHVLVCFQVRIGFGEGKESAKGRSQRPLGLAEFPDRRGVGGIRLGCIEARDCGVAGPHDGVERFPLVFHVPFDRFDEIGNEIVSPRQLYVDLRKGIFDAIPEIDQAVVNADCIQNQCGNDREEYQE